MKNIKILIIGLVLTIAIVGTVALTRENQDKRSSAYFAGSRLFLLPEDKALAKDETFTVQLWIETGNITGTSQPAKVDGLTTYVCYDDRKLSIGVSESNMANIVFPNKETSSFNELILSREVGVSYPSDINKCIDLSVASNRPVADLSSGMVSAARIIFKAITPGVSGEITIDKARSVVSGVSAENDTAMSVDRVTGIRYTIAGIGGTPTPSPTIGAPTPTPTILNLPQCGTCNENTLCGYRCQQNGVAKVCRKVGTGTYQFYPAGDIQTSCATSHPQPDVTCKSDTGSEETKYVCCEGTDNNIYVPTSKWAYRTSGCLTATNWPILKYAISYQAIGVGNSCSVNWPVVITAVAQDGTKKIYSNQVPVREVSAANKVIYRGELPLVDFPYKENVSIFVKGPKHLQTKYGVNNQTAYYDKLIGTIKLYSIGSTEIVNDFSGYPLMPGDMSGATVGVPDGVINGQDFAYMKLAVDRGQKTTVGQSIQADLNGDCEANGADTGLFKKSLQDKMEQLY